MIEVGREYRDPRIGTAVTVLRRDPEVFEIEVRILAGRGRTRPHVHLDFAQTFTVVEGRAAAQLAGGKRVLAAGESLDVPMGVPHQDPWNPGPGEAVIRNRISPTTPFLEAFVETVLARTVSGRMPEGGELSPLHVAVIAASTNGQSYAAGPPIGAQRAALPLMAALGRRRGYDVETLPAMA